MRDPVTESQTGGQCLPRRRGATWVTEEVGGMFSNKGRSSAFEVCDEQGTRAHADGATPNRVVPLDLEQLFRAHHDFVWSTLAMRGVPRSMVDDATQEVFLVLVRRRYELDGSRPVKGLLYGIARNVARAIRRRLPATDEHGAERLAELASSQRDLERASDVARAIDRTFRFLDTLDEARRDAFVLTEIEQMTAPEITEILGVNLNTVYSRVHDARKRYAAFLRREHGEAPHRDAGPAVGAHG